MVTRGGNATKLGGKITKKWFENLACKQKMNYSLLNWKGVDVDAVGKVGFFAKILPKFCQAPAGKAPAERAKSVKVKAGERKIKN